MLKVLSLLMIAFITPALFAELPAGSTSNVNSGKIQENKSIQKDTSVTDLIAHWGIPEYSFQETLPNVTQRLYGAVNGIYTLDTEIVLDNNENPHPEVEKLLLFLGYQEELCCSSAKTIHKDALTQTQSIENLYGERVSIKLRTLLTVEQLESFRKKSKK